METREFLNAWIGHLDQKRQDYAAAFETVKFGSFYNTFSEEQQKALQKVKNPYVDSKQKKGKPVTMGDISSTLSALAKASNNE